MFGETCTHKKQIIHTRCCKNVTKGEQLANILITINYRNISSDNDLLIDIKLMVAIS